MKYKGFEIKIERDDYVESPRVWDNLGIILTAERGRYGSVNEVEAWIVDDVRQAVNYGVNAKDALAEHFGEIAVVLPVYKYVHSIVSYSTRPYTGGGWDSCQCGYIFVARERVLKEYGRERLSQKLLEKVAGVLKGEIEILNQWATGDVWGYDIEGLNGSCWGFFGYDYCLSEAKSVIDWHVNKINNAPETRAPLMALLD